MKPRGEFWELAACGAAAGGVSVWALAAAARAGWLRALLDLFPPSTWDAVTWALIPLLLLVPMAVQGAVVAAASYRPRLTGRAAAGGIGGSLLALIAAGILASTALRRLSPSLVGTFARPLPDPLILGSATLLAGGWLLVAGRLFGSFRLRRAALALAALGTITAWLVARGWVLAASDVLDRIEVVAFFIAVVVGGGLGCAWLVARSQGPDLTGPRAGRYNVRNLPRRPERGEKGGESIPSMVRK